MENNLLTILTSPQRFFAGKEERPASLRTPALIVLLTGLVSAISAYLIAGVTMQVLPASAQGMIGLIQGISVVSAIIGTLIMWVVVTVIFYLISMAFHGTGDFKQVLEVTGYGFIPQIISGIVALPLMFQYLGTVSLPSTTDATMIQEAVKAMMKAPSMTMITLIGIVFLLWSANIWIFGVKQTRHLTTRDAIITVGLPILLYVLYSLSQLIG